MRAKSLRISSRVRASEILRPRGGRIGVDDDRHLAARVRRAGELVFGRALERQRETLPGHHQRRAEDLRHVVEIAAAPARRAPRGSDGCGRAGSRPCRRPCAAPRCPWESRTPPRARRSRSERKPAQPARQDGSQRWRQTRPGSSVRARAPTLATGCSGRARNRRRCGRTASARASARRGRQVGERRMIVNVGCRRTGSSSR